MKLEDARVLVVDDELALCRIFSKWLGKAGYSRIRIAANGAEAVEAIRQEPIDVLITDVCMPVMDGVSLVRKLAEQGEHIHTIIFVSGFGDVDRREMYDLGVENFLAKPFRLEELASAVGDAIADRDALWASPMEIPPRQAMQVCVPDVATVCSSESEAQIAAEGGLVHFSLGRGGFSVRAEEPLGLGKVNFHCVFFAPDSNGAGHPDLRGQGFVRWRSTLDQAVGIEFAFLESPGREWVVEQIIKSNPRSFIPALHPAGESSRSLARRDFTLLPSRG